MTLTDAEIALRVARHEYPDEMYIFNAGFVYPIKKGCNQNTTFKLDDATMMPLWRREANNYRDHLMQRSWGDDLDIYKDLFYASQSPRAIALALLEMWGLDKEITDEN